MEHEFHPAFLRHEPELVRAPRMTFDDRWHDRELTGNRYRQFKRRIRKDPFSKIESGFAPSQLPSAARRTMLLPKRNIPKEHQSQQQKVNHQLKFRNVVGELKAQPSRINRRGQSSKEGEDRPHKTASGGRDYKTVMKRLSKVVARAK